MFLLCVGRSRNKLGYHGLFVLGSVSCVKHVILASFCLSSTATHGHVLLEEQVINETLIHTGRKWHAVKLLPLVSIYPTNRKMKVF